MTVDCYDCALKEDGKPDTLGVKTFRCAVVRNGEKRYALCIVRNMNHDCEFFQKKKGIIRRVKEWIVSTTSSRCIICKRLEWRRCCGGYDFVCSIPSNMGPPMPFSECRNYNADGKCRHYKRALTAWWRKEWWKL